MSYILKTMDTAYPGFRITPHESFGGQPNEYKNKSQIEFEAALHAAMSTPIDMQTYNRHSAMVNYILGDRVERMALMANYPNVYQYVERLVDSVGALSGWKQTHITNAIPRLIERLRITLLGPEANQVNGICGTQDMGHLCQNVYSMCLDHGGTTTDRNRRADGQVNVETADRECVHYLKERVFPVESKQDPDVRQYFQTYDYARDGREYLQPYATKHDWMMEHRPDVRNQWDLTSLDGHNFAERASRDWSQSNWDQRPDQRPDNYADSYYQQAGAAKPPRNSVRR